MEEKLNKITKNIKFPFSWRQVGFFLLIIFILLIFLFGAVLVYGKTYEGKVLPGIKIGHVPIGGMERAELSAFLDKMNDKLVETGLTFSYQVDGVKKDLVIYPVLVSEGGSIDLIRQDIEKETDFLFSYGKEGNLIFSSFRTLKIRLKKVDLPLNHLYIDRANLLNTLQDNLISFEQKPVNANVIIESVNPLDYQVSSSTVGFVFDYNSSLDRAINQWKWFETVKVDLLLKRYEPEVLENDVSTIISRLENIFINGDLRLSFKDLQTNLSREWILDLQKLKIWIEVQPRESGFVFGLNKENVLKFLQEEVTNKINIQAQNAKFETDSSGRVVEFQGSRPGVEVDLEKTYEKINNAFIERTLHDSGITKVVSVEVQIAEPKISTGDVNDLGISEILGVGISDYSNSPINRIKNIRNAVNKLNGLLIKPGEIFSTIEYTKPFTLEGGYYPELVIKGDELKPEIGGGLCQIGTTLFRMAMNSGMHITERRNHSLVVSHYNDPVNNLPGTDATVYDPAPDFKFKNDTNNYILIQTYMDVATEQLFFTLWGTSDGRQGSYTHPVVDKWIPYGPVKNIETTKLAPGEKTCQNAFKGADTHFTYTRKLADGTVENKVFESHYRPLPMICLVGVEEIVIEEESLNSSVDENNLPLVEDINIDEIE